MACNARTWRRAWAVLLAGVVMSLAAQHAHAQKPQPHQSTRQPAPQFIRKDLNGHAVNLRALKGKVVLLNFWATWCGPCQVELPKFSAWQKQYGASGLKVIAVSMDDEAAPVRAVARKLKLDMPVVMGDAKLGTLYGGVLGLPVTYLIARDGTVAARIEGKADLAGMETSIQKLLGQR